MFDTKTEDVKRLIYVQYILITLETPVGIYLTYKFPDFNLSILALVVASTLVPTILLHLLVITQASKLLRDIGLLILAAATLASLTAVMHYIPSIRPALILMYIPSVVFAASQSLSFGVAVSMIMVFFFTLLTGGEYFNFHPIFKTAVDLSSLGQAWQISNLFSFFFLLILAFLSNYFFEILRRREKKIQHLAEINRKLYQRSKTTSDKILRSMKEALVVVDNQYKIVQYNSAFRKMANHNLSLTGEKLLSLNLDFEKSLIDYLYNLKYEGAKSLRFETRDKVGHNYDINISTIELQRDENGFLIIINKNPLPWGFVFDSKTKRPIDLVLIRLFNAKDRKVIETKVTDHKGRFGFIIPLGKYYISASKEGYNFPSVIEKSDYHGEEISITSAVESVVKISIPLDYVINKKSQKLEQN